MGRNFTVQGILEAQKAEEEEYQGMKNCSKHFEQRLMLFCQTDRQLICQECLIQDHFGHNLEDAKPYLFGQKAMENCSQNQVDLKIFNAEMDSLSEKITEQGKLNMIKISKAYFRLKNALITEKHKAQSINGLELVTLDEKTKAFKDVLQIHKTTADRHEFTLRSRIPKCTREELMKTDVAKKELKSVIDEQRKYLTDVLLSKKLINQEKYVDNVL